MKKYWAELLILILFLVSDLVWDGLASALATVFAGILAFLVLLISGTKKPMLLLEGLGFGILIFVGEFVTYPGGKILFFELIFALILLVPAIFKKNILQKFMGSLGKGLFSAKEAFRLSLILGFIMLSHAVICTILALTGFFSWWVGAILFVSIYLVVLKKTKRGTLQLAEKSLPVLKSESEGNYSLEVGSVSLGKMSIVYENPSSVLIEVISIESSVHELLWELEKALRILKVRTISIINWHFDEMELEMDGYVIFAGKWKKKL